MFRLSTITNLETMSHFKILRDPNSNRINDLLINKTIQVNFFDNLLTLPDTDKRFELRGRLLKMMTNKQYNVDFANILDN